MQAAAATHVQSRIERRTRQCAPCGGCKIMGSNIGPTLRRFDHLNVIICIILSVSWFPLFPFSCQCVFLKHCDNHLPLKFNVSCHKRRYQITFECMRTGPALLLES